MEKKLRKRLFSMCIVIAMVLSMCPTMVFAEGAIPATADFSEYTYVAFGDSLVYGADGDTGSRMEKPYVNLVGEALGIGNVINLARSGSTWTECPPRVNMAQRAIKYNGKADIISVGLGTNDYAAKKALGDMNSRDNTTIYGSIHMVAESLTTKYPDAFIFFTTPAKYKTENNGIYTLADVAQAIKDVAAEYDIPVLDLYNKFDWDPLTEVKDQIHPNQKHHTEELAPLVTEFIREHMESVSKNACPCATCDGADATWTTWDGTTAFENGKHYRLADNVQLTGMVTIPKGTTVVLDLNGKTITAAANSRCFEVSGELSIINSTADTDADGNYTGLITGGVAATNDTDNVLRGGNINIEKGTSSSAPGGTLKLYGGTIANGQASNAGGNVKVGKFAKFYMYGGTITAGNAANGGNMNVDNGAKFYMHGGTISSGVATGSGGNIYVWKGTINLYDGVITGGSSSGTGSKAGGGNIWLNAASATLNMYGGEISDGEAKKFGGNIYVDNATGKVNMEGGLITGGKTASHGGNIYVSAGTVKMTGGVISNGKANWDTATSAHSTASNDGGNIYLSGAKAYLGGDATITGGSVGTADNQYGGNVYATTAGAAIYLQDQAQVLGGSAYEGKNIYAMTDVTVTMYGGTVKNGNFKVGSSGSFHMYGGQVEDMVWTSSETYETVIYNGILGSNSSGLPEKLAACKAACATVAQTTHVEGHTVYAVYQTSLTEGACAACGHTYSAANCGTCSTYSHPAVKVANCEFCNKDVVWAPMLGNELVADHYYLAEDVALTGKIGLTVDDAVCIDLNGHNLTTADVTTGITMTSAKLNITNTSADASAIISGGGGILAANKASGEARSVVNFKNVTVSGGHSIDNGGNISTNAVDLVIDNCIIRDGYASKNGGNVCCYATKLIIKGNTQIVKGFAFNNGDDLYLGTTSKAQMYSGTVGDICQLNSTGSLHLYDGTVDKLLSYNYGSYNSCFYMYGGTVNSIGVAQQDKTMANGVIALYAGTVGNDPLTANYKDTTMVAPCSCVIKNADGTYTILHTGGTSTCDICSANDVYEGGYTFPEAFVGEHAYPESWAEGEKVCENCGSISACEHANTTLTGYQAATCLAPGYSGDYICDECGITTQAGEPTDQLEHSYTGDNGVCINGCGETNAHQHEFDSSYRCTICGETAEAVVTDYYGEILGIYASLAEALEVHNGVFVTVTILKDLEVQWDAIYNSWDNALANITLAANGASLTDTSNGAVYFNQVKFASGLTFTSSAHSYIHFTEIYGDVTLEKATFSDGIYVYGDQDGKLTTRCEVKLEASTYMNVIGKGDGTVVWEASTCREGDTRYGVWFVDNSQLIVNNAVVEAAGFLMEADSGLSMHNATVKLLAVSTDVAGNYTLKMTGTSHGDMEGDCSLELAGALLIESPAWFSLSETGKLVTATEGLCNTGVMPPMVELWPGCIYYVDGAYVLNDHTYQLVEGVEVCQNCDRIWCENNGHIRTTDIEVIIPATCMDGGWAHFIKRCEVCNKIYEEWEDSLDKKECQFDETTNICVNGCGRHICDAIWHTSGETWEEDVAATCQAPGSRKVVSNCQICGEKYTIEETTFEQLTHEYDADTGVCKNGCDKKECYNTNGCIAGEPQEEDIVEATCKAPGSYNLVTRCTLCGEILATEAKEISQKDHVYTCTPKDDAFHTIGCQNCDYAVDEAHSDNTVTYTDPTTEKDGFWIHTCACSYSYTVTDFGSRKEVFLPPLDPDFAENNVESDSDVTEDEVDGIIDRVIHQKDAVLDKDIFISDENEAVIEQMKQEKPELADKQPVLEIALKGITLKTKAGKLVANKLVFDVTPMLGDTKIENLQAPLTFHLPVDDSLTGNAYVFHEGEFLGVYEIITEGGHNYIVVSAQNFSKFTVEVQDENDVVVNTTTGESYTSVQDALNAASKGDTVKLLKDAVEEDVFVGSQKTLDLNGHKLTADSINASFGTSHIIDATNGEGLLVVDKANISLNSSNKQLPLWSDEGARFVNVSFGQALDIKADKNGNEGNLAYYRFAFDDKAAQTILDDYLANGIEGTCITIRIKVTYATGSGTVTQYYDIPNALVIEYLTSGNGWDANMFKLNLTGVAGKDVKLSAEIVSTANSEATVVIASTSL